MIHAIGYACQCLGLPERSISRTVRVANATPARLRELVQANLTDLSAIFEYNVAHRLCLFRINQSIVPLASHPVNQVPWWKPEEFGDQLVALGRTVLENGLRVSMHPGQYTVLNSLTPKTVEAAKAELGVTVRFLDVMGLGPDHKVVIHGGGGKPDKAQALERLAENLGQLDASVRRRLVLENDDRTFSVADLLPVCQQMGVPLVFDWLHHHSCAGPWKDRPVEEIMALVASTWKPQDGPPKVHFSTQDPDKRPGAHARWVDSEDFLAFVQAMDPFLVDVMVESKAKDLAVLRLREELNLRSDPCHPGCP